MGATDRFGGPAAWDIHCAETEAKLMNMRKANPGCGTCKSGIKCPDCGAVYCTEEGEWMDEFNPPCDYEGWEPR